MKLQASRRVENIHEYFFSQKLKEIDVLNTQGESIINLGIGNPDLPPSQNTINKLAEYSGKINVHGYQKYIGVDKLRIAFADWYRKYFDVSLNYNSEILPLMGSKEGILYISLAYLNMGDQVLIPNPGYPTYSSVVNLIGAEVVEYNLIAKNSWCPDFDQLEKYDLSKVKLMWVNYPNMPTGAIATIELFEKLVEFGLKHNILICNDNPYSFILNNNPNSILSISGAKDIAVELNSLSKSHNMAGWRMGVVAGGENVIKNIIKVNTNIQSGIFLPMQIAAAEALNNPDSWYYNLNVTYFERRKIVYEILDAIGCYYTKNQSGMFVWARVGAKYADGKELSEDILKNARVFITPGFIFGTNGDKYIRISLCASEQQLVEARDRITNSI